ncbi:hypothetical protein AAE026_24050 [Bradyrhizobium sp. DN5]|uniref:hypothetical protein n=1 Tax=Bradyrhizobium sp. DN5 TaxID=3056950 RepID=UPI0035259F66
MLMIKERRPAIRTLHGWAISVLQEAGAIHECEEHGWMQDRADPHARDRAYDIARRDPPAGVGPDKATDAITELLVSVGDTCPECPPKDSSDAARLDRERL